MIWNELLAMDMKNSIHLKKSVLDKKIIVEFGGVTRFKSSKRV